MYNNQTKGALITWADNSTAAWPKAKISSCHQHDGKHKQCKKETRIPQPDHATLQSYIMLRKFTTNHIVLDIDRLAEVTIWEATIIMWNDNENMHDHIDEPLPHINMTIHIHYQNIIKMRRTKKCKDTYLILVLEGKTKSWSQ